MRCGGTTDTAVAVAASNEVDNGEGVDALVQEGFDRDSVMALKVGRLRDALLLLAHIVRRD